jgi:hypothetical protein
VTTGTLACGSCCSSVGAVACLLHWDALTRAATTAFVRPVPLEGARCWKATASLRHSLLLLPLKGYPGCCTTTSSQTQRMPDCSVYATKTHTYLYHSILVLLHACNSCNRAATATAHVFACSCCILVFSPQRTHTTTYLYYYTGCCTTTSS